MKKNLIYIISLAFILGFGFLPPISGMTASGMQVVGIFIGTLILWLTTAIDWPSVLCLLALMLVPDLKVNGILQSSLGNATFAFLLFTFACTYAVSKTSFVKKCAVAFITNPIARRGSWWFVGFYSLSVLVIGMFMSPSVLFVIYLPIHETICSELGLEKNDRLANMLMMANLFCCAIACGMTPIAHVFPVMALGFFETAAGHAISYASYMTAAIPVGLICFVIMMLLFRFVINPDMSRLSELNFDALRKDVRPLSTREKWIVGIFAGVVAMWILPDLFKSSVPLLAALSAKGTTFPPMLGCVAMFMISIDGEPLLNFREATSKGVQWGSLFMAAATLALGSAMTNETIGLTAWLSQTIQPVFSGMSPSMVVLVFMIWAYIMTNACSNMVTVTVVCAVALPICLASNGTLSAAAMASMIGMAASYAFVLPPAHPNVAVAIGSGWTSTSQIIRYGGILMLIAIAVTVLLGYPLAASVMAAL